MDTINSNKGNIINDINNTVARKCSWIELKTIVSDLRREIATISSLLPMQISFRRLSSGKVRIYYLVNSPDCWGIPLMYVNVPTNSGFSNNR